MNKESQTEDYNNKAIGSTVASERFYRSNVANALETTD